MKTTPETSGEDVKNPLETSVFFPKFEEAHAATKALIDEGQAGHVVKGKRLVVKKADPRPRDGKTTLATSGEDVKLHSKRVEKM